MTLVRILRPLALLLLCAGIACGGPARAQGTAATDPLAAAQAAVEAGDADAARLESLRLAVIAARDSAAAVLERGSVEARAAQAQLDALGPAPVEGEPEAADIAARRAELVEALAAASAPLRKAEEDIRRAGVLLDEIGRLAARRTQEALLSRQPSALLPGTWAAALPDLELWAARVAREGAVIARDPASVERLRAARLPAAGLAALGLALILLGSPLLGRALRGVLADGARRPGAAFLGRLAQLAPSALGAALLLLALGQFGPPPQALARAVALAPGIALFCIGGWWLGLALFAPDAHATRMIPLSDADARAAARLSTGLGVALGLELAAEALADGHFFAGATISAVAAPIILSAAWMLWRLAARLRPLSEAGSHAGGESQRLLARAMQVGALVIAVGVALGFVTLAREITDSVMLTVALAALALAAHRGVMVAIEAALTAPTGEREPLALLPVGVGAIIALLWAPMLLIAWGATVTDLAEIGRRLSEGVAFGDVRLSLDGLASLAVVFTLGLLLTRWAQKLLRVTVLPRTRLDAGARNALITGTGYLGVSLAALTAVSAAGLDLSNLAVIAGALSVGVGFGLQSVASNFVSGLILLIERPIRQGDLIEVAGATGYVREIAVRATRIQTFDRHDVIVPNAELITGVVRNLTLTGRAGRLIVPVGVAYGADPDRVIEILTATATGHPRVMADPAPFAVFTALGDSALSFELYCHLVDIGETLTVRSDILRRICRDLDAAGIEIPFPQRDIRLRDLDRIAEALGGGSAARLPP